MSWDLALSSQAKAWLQSHAPEPAGTVSRWLTDVLCEEEAAELIEISEMGGPRRYVSPVEGTDIDVIWIKANPFHTIKVLWIEFFSERSRV